ncbi:MAG TPA: hypothetical protein VJA21_17045, partial [Verrucomicrobiae bacterium]
PVLPAAGSSRGVHETHRADCEAARTAAQNITQSTPASKAPVPRLTFPKVSGGLTGSIRAQ